MSVVLVTGARAPVALHLARVLSAAGHVVVLADSLGSPLARYSRACARYHRLPAPAEAPEAFAAALGEVIASERPSHVIPTCEEVFYLAWAFETYRYPTRLLAPPFATLARAHDKAAFAHDAKAYGLAPPATVRIDDRDGLARVRADSGRLVLKPVWSRFATRTLIAPQPAALDRIVSTPGAPWVAQELVAGEELCAYAVAQEGRVVALAAYRPVHRAGLGAAIYFAPVEDADIAGDVARYVAATRWSGQISFDFRRDASGRPRVLECNPRATSGVHFFGHGAGLAAALLEGHAAAPTIASPLMVPAAMLVYGLPRALGSGGVTAWARDAWRGRNALAWPGDRLAPWVEPRAVLELWATARRMGCSLIEASTHGIAWDGAPMPAGPRQEGRV